MCSIAYAIIPTYLNKYYDTNVNVPEIKSYNATMSAVNGLGSYTSWSGIVIIILTVIIFLIIFTHQAMSLAY